MSYEPMPGTAGGADPACLHRGLSGSEAEAILRKSGKKGDYLVRESESSPGAYTLCILYKKTIHNYRMSPDSDGKLCAEVKKGVPIKKFSTLGDIIKDYIGLGKYNGLVCPLLRPIKCDENPKQYYSEISYGDTVTLNVGDHVKIDSDLAFIRKMQIGHGGWNETIPKLTNEVGTVRSVDQNGDLKVFINGGFYTFNPAVCQKATTQDIKHIDVEHAKRNIKLPDYPLYTNHVAAESRFKTNAKVRVIADSNSLEELQRAHGGWNEDMTQILSETGIVEGSNSAGDLNVNFAGIVWTLNPEACRVLEESLA